VLEDSFDILIDQLWTK